jgi:hypothetical protein
MALDTRFSRPGFGERTARHEVASHFLHFDANGGTLRRQEIAQLLLCNRQRPGVVELRGKFSQCPDRERNDANPDPGNEPYKTTARTECNAAGRELRKPPVAGKLPCRGASSDASHSCS